MNRRFFRLLCTGMFLLAFSFCFSIHPLLAQETSSEKYLNQEFELGDGDTASLSNFQAQASSPDVNQGDNSMTWYLFKTFLILIGLSGAIWAILKFLKQTGFGGASNPFMSIHSTLALGQSQYLQIVQVGKRFYMLGVTDSNVQMLGEIEDEETVTDLQLHSGDSGEQNSSGDTGGFQDVLQKFVGTAQHNFSEGQESNSGDGQFSDLRNKIQDLRKSGGEA